MAEEALTLKGLMEEFGGKFDDYGTLMEPGLLTLDASIPSDNLVDIASGGIQMRGAQPPALCDDAMLALKLWQKAARDYAYSRPGITRFKWIEKPELDRWQITITDARFTHRLVSDRYAVYSRIAVASSS